MHYIIVRYCTHKASYRPQTKLWEGNIFTGVCLSTRRGVVPSHHNPLDYTIPGLYPVPPGPYLLRTIPITRTIPPDPLSQNHKSGTHPTGMFSCFRLHFAVAPQRRNAFHNYIYNKGWLVHKDTRFTERFLQHKPYLQ